MASVFVVSTEVSSMLAVERVLLPTAALSAGAVARLPESEEICLLRYTAPASSASAMISADRAFNRMHLIAD